MAMATVAMTAVLRRANLLLSGRSHASHAGTGTSLRTESRTIFSGHGDGDPAAVRADQAAGKGEHLLTLSLRSAASIRVGLTSWSSRSDCTRRYGGGCGAASTD